MPDAAPVIPDAAPPAPPPAPEPPFPASVRSLQLKRSIAVRMAPAAGADRYGTIAAHIRVGWKQVVENQDCSRRWVEITPYGWICEIYLRPSERGRYGVEMPRLEPEEVVPGIYGKVRAKAPAAYEKEGDVMVESRALTGSIMVRKFGETSVEGKDYWLVDKRNREYMASADIREFQPSTWRGMRLGDDMGTSLPIGFPLGRKSIDGKVPVYRNARDGAIAGTIRGRQPVAVLETATDADGTPIAYRIGDDRWLKARDIRVARLTAPPPATGPIERWIDMDLDQQVLVAYEGQMPVYVTLTSTGTRNTPTPTGIYRIWIKFAETDMSDLGAESPYSVSTVPWSQFYAKDLALHTAYWHDNFGTPRSHGCTNLSPMDARYLYFWSEPEVPPGWSMAKGTVERPGSLVRLRSAADPEPAFQGYAAEIYEARLARQHGSRQASN